MVQSVCYISVYSVAYGSQVGDWDVFMAVIDPSPEVPPLDRGQDKDLQGLTWTYLRLGKQQGDWSSPGRVWQVEWQIPKLTCLISFDLNDYGKKVIMPNRTAIFMLRDIKESFMFLKFDRWLSCIAAESPVNFTNLSWTVYAFQKQDGSWNFVFWYLHNLKPKPNQSMYIYIYIYIKISASNTSMHINSPPWDQLLTWVQESYGSISVLHQCVLCGLWVPSGWLRCIHGSHWSLTWGPSPWQMAEQGLTRTYLDLPEVR